jgi:hypothetical protein
MSRGTKSQPRVSVVELAQDKGWISQFLRLFPDWVLREADRRAEQDACWKEKHNDPNRLPFADPWQFLIDAPATIPPLKTICRAAQSQLTAYRKFCHLALGISTLKTDWYQEALDARAAGNKRRSDHAELKVAFALSKFKPAQKFLKDWILHNPAKEESAERWQEDCRRELVKRGRRDMMDSPRPIPRAAVAGQERRLALILADNWLQMGVLPGLMFWSNKAAEKMISTVALKQSNSSAHSFKKIRQRMGLIPADIRRFTVWNVQIARRNNGVTVVTGFAQDGEQLF